MIELIIERWTNLDGSSREILIRGLADPPLLTLDSRTAPVPEPVTLLLLSIGTLGLIGYAWRRRKMAAA